MSTPRLSFASPRIPHRAGEGVDRHEEFGLDRLVFRLPGGFLLAPGAEQLHLLPVKRAHQRGAEHVGIVVAFAALFDGSAQERLQVAAGQVKLVFENLGEFVPERLILDQIDV